ncbi:DUF1127 domain-containing protein [Martelella alba]|uniref:DUF1127 domain-containing protein n=1 Tax=Martelella alba TaxID=2590451 RepID=A0A506U833_9HYPH|nr:DUF1127 domain-containing protein [Martelella alba]TPW28779.1 DUF1127 domain-containing protein [Martelella alba]
MSMIDRAVGTKAIAQRPYTIFDAARSAFAGTVRFFRNRFAVKRMVDMDDALLNDIGLTRADVERAYLAPAMADPMLDLKRAARKRIGELHL